ATAESAPRVWRQWLARREPAERDRLQRRMSGALAGLLLALAIACVAVHPVFAAWTAKQVQIREQVQRLVPVDRVFITNWAATGKFLPQLEQKFRPIDRSVIAPEDVPALVDRYGQVFIVFLDRTDSDFWRQDAQSTEEFMAALTPPPELLLDRQATSTDRL